jgi:predicted kinase
MMHSVDFTDAVAHVRAQLVCPAETLVAPVLIVISGLPGTGKSHLARRLAERLPSVIVQSDFVRKIILPRPTYASAENLYVHRVAHAIIEQLLRAGYRVISDATNLAEWHREKLYRVAERTGAKLVVVRTVAPEEIVRARLAVRVMQREPTELSDADWGVHELLKPQVEPVERPHFVVDTSDNFEIALARILRAAR